MAKILQDLDRTFSSGDAIIKLIILNVLVFLLSSFVLLGLYLFSMDVLTSESLISKWLYLPAQFGRFFFRPWTMFSYMFMHAGFWHLVWNMLMLFWFGSLLNNLLPNRNIFGLYLLGGISGGIFFMLAYNVFPILVESLDNAVLVGASASAMAFVVGASTMLPQMRLRLLFIGEIKLQYIALFLVVMDLIMLPVSNPGGHFAHLGGAFMGWFYISQLRNGRDLARPFYLLAKLFSKGKASTPEPAPRKQPRTVPLQRIPRPYVAEEEEDEIRNSDYSRAFLLQYRNLSEEDCMNAILDKINRTGYENLSTDEKKFLHNQAKK